MFSICVCAARAVSTLAAVFTPGLNGPHWLAVVDFSSPFALVRTLCCNFNAKDKSALGQSDGGADISKPFSCSGETLTAEIIHMPPSAVPNNNRMNQDRSST